MEPQIQYARTSDGVSIAYSEVGDGRPLIVLPPPGVNHVEQALSMFAFLRELANRFRIVWFDWRGTGLSDRGAVDFSIAALVRDLDAVVASSRAESFILGAWGQALPIAITYAVDNPKRASHLVLTDGFTNFSDFAKSPAYRALLPLLEADWDVYADVISGVLWSSANSEFARQFADYMRASCGPETSRETWRAFESYDVSDVLSQVTTPTLVVHNKTSRLFTLALGQRTAASIPHARLALIDDVTYASLPDLVEEFVFGEAKDRRLRPAPAQSLQGTAVILFADIADSTALTERLGDAAFREKARGLDESLRNAITSNGGTAIEGKLLGDGVLAVFGAAREAIACAMAIHGMAGSRVAGRGSRDDDRLLLHVGIHAGDVIREDNNVYGGAVNIASRVASEAAAGETLVSGTVRDLARTSAGVSFEDCGERELKGVSEPVRVWAVRQGGV